MIFIKWLIRVLFWLQAFVAPLILMGLTALAINKASLVVPLLIVGGVIGIIFAEYIRRKYGLEAFFARIYGSNEMDNKKEKR